MHTTVQTRTSGQKLSFFPYAKIKKLNLRITSKSEAAAFRLLLQWVTCPLETLCCNISPLDTADLAATMKRKTQLLLIRKTRTPNCRMDNSGPRHAKISNIQYLVKSFSVENVWRKSSLFSTRVSAKILWKIIIKKKKKNHKGYQQSTETFNKEASEYL